MHKTKQNKKTKGNHHNTRYTWFTPSVGATSTELLFYSTLSNNTVLICALSYRSSQSTQNCTLSYRSFLPKPSAHSAVEVVHTLSWDLTLNPKNRS